MVRIFRNTDTRQCIHIIRQFLHYAAQFNRTKQDAMNDLICYVMGRPVADSLLTNNNAPQVAKIKQIALSRHSSVHMGFLLALPEVCKSITNNEMSLPFILSQPDTGSDLVAAFYNQLRNQPANQMRFRLNDAWSSLTNKNTETTLLFCIRTFVPELVIDREFPRDESSFQLFNNIIDTINCKTSISYMNNALSSKNPNAMFLFFKSLNIANRLSITAGSFDEWTVDDMQHLFRMLRSCPHITHLNLSDMQLNTCCEDEEKFSCLLDLLSVPHLQFVNLSGNHLSKLPEEKRKLLNTVIAMSPIEKIQLRTVPNQNFLSLVAKEPKNKVEESSSLYMMVL